MNITKLIQYLHLRYIGIKGRKIMKIICEAVGCAYNHNDRCEADEIYVNIDTFCITWVEREGEGTDEIPTINHRGVQDGQYELL